MSCLSISCDSIENNIILCLDSCFPCIYNISSSKCSDVETCDINFVNILPNNVTMEKCSMNDANNSSDCPSYVDWIAYIGLLIWVGGLYGIFKRDTHASLVYGISLLTSIIILVMIILFALDFHSLSCGYQWTLTYIVLGIFPLMLMSLIFCLEILTIGLKNKLQKMWKYRIKERELIFRRGKIKELFDLTLFPEKFVMRLVLDYYGEIEANELDLFVKIKISENEEEKHVEIELEEFKEIIING